MTQNRRTLDQYFTPNKATSILLDNLTENWFYYGLTEDVEPKFLSANHKIIEPCCGDGAISYVIKSRLKTQVISNDIDPSLSESNKDASDRETWEALDKITPIDWTITNPPYNLAAEILTLAYSFSRVGVAAFLRLSFLEPCKNRELLTVEHPPDQIVVLPRISFTGDNKTDSVTCGWFIWNKNSDFFCGKPLIVVSKDNFYS